MSKAFKLNIGGVTNWYDHFVAADIELIAAYIEQSEISNSIAIHEYHKLKNVNVEEIDDYNAIITTSFRGVDGSLFNAQDIYENVFPMLNRHSTLVIIMSMFEKRLSQLCDWLDLKIAFKKKGKGSLLEQIKNYLINQAGLNFNIVIENGWSQLMVLQSIRNNITHNYGKYEAKNKYINNYVKSNRKINKENEFVFNHEFLKDLVPNFNVLCEELQKVIREKSNNN